MPRTSQIIAVFVVMGFLAAGTFAVTPAVDYHLFTAHPITAFSLRFAVMLLIWLRYVTSPQLPE
jgi:hypothetical protein